MIAIFLRAENEHYTNRANAIQGFLHGSESSLLCHAPVSDSPTKPSLYMKNFLEKVSAQFHLAPAPKVTKKADFRSFRKFHEGFVNILSNYEKNKDNVSILFLFIKKQLISV
jgi:hypothetical protein